jgi:hypothetical protein
LLSHFDPFLRCVVIPNSFAAFEIPHANADYTA